MALRSRTEAFYTFMGKDSLKTVPVNVEHVELLHAHIKKVYPLMTDADCYGIAFHHWKVSVANGFYGKYFFQYFKKLRKGLQDETAN